MFPRFVLVVSLWNVCFLTSFLLLRFFSLMTGNGGGWMCAGGRTAGKGWLTAKEGTLDVRTGACREGFDRDGRF